MYECLVVVGVVVMLDDAKNLLSAAFGAAQDQLRDRAYPRTFATADFACLRLSYSTHAPKPTALATDDYKTINGYTAIIRCTNSKSVWRDRVCVWVFSASQVYCVFKAEYTTDSTRYM